LTELPSPLELRVAELEHFVEVQRSRGVEKIRRALANAGVIASKEEKLTEFVRARFLHYSIPFQEQCRLSESDRVDFMAYVHRAAPTNGTDSLAPIVPMRICLELKVQGGKAPLIRQLDRYAELNVFDAIIVVSTKRSLVTGLPKELHGKEVHAIVVGAL
jgi:hypothetical protein